MAEAVSLIIRTSPLVPACASGPASGRTCSRSALRALAAAMKAADRGVGVAPIRWPRW